MTTQINVQRNSSAQFNVPVRVASEMTIEELCRKLRDIRLQEVAIYEAALHFGADDTTSAIRKAWREGRIVPPQSQ